MTPYWDIFLTFTRIGGLTFGGGYSMLPMLQREAVEKKGWISEQDLLDSFSISQVLPGMIAINCAIFVGNRVRGWRGSLMAALGVAFPSLLIITLIAALISNFVDLPSVQHAFAGIRACVFVLIIQAIIKLAKGAVVDWFSLLLCLMVFGLSMTTRLNPVIFVLGAGLLGFLWRQLRREGKA